MVTAVDGERRFPFGANWWSYLQSVDEGKIAAAQKALTDALGAAGWAGRRFLDAGCGSGIHALAARRLGATVTAFDYDPQSVACAEWLKNRFAPGDPLWTVGPGSVLDENFMGGLGDFDVVYSWGVLHHTGRMWDALARAAARVAPGGRLFIALYNDQGFLSRAWRAVKRTYVSGRAGRWAVKAVFIPLLAARAVAAGVLKHGGPLGQFRAYRKNRGMSLYHDWIDWLGGYPFEVATPAAVTAFLSARGFRLTTLLPTRSFGCNQFVYERGAA